MVRVLPPISSFDPKDAFKPTPSLQKFRITILGDREVGKTALVVRFLTHHHILEYDKGNDCYYRYETMVDQDQVWYGIFDASSPFTLNYKRFNFASHKTTIYLIVYSITDRDSFRYVRKLLRHFSQLKRSGISLPAIAVVGNKIDRLYMRQINYEEVKNLCDKYNELQVVYFGEICVADELVQKLFSDIYRWLKEQRLLPNDKPVANTDNE